MYQVNVHPDAGKTATHDISLSDGTTEIGLIVCDSAGNHDPYNISRNPISRTAIKTSTGTQKYGDFEPPWMVIAQDDFQGGRAQEDIEKDDTRFFDSYRAQTAFSEIYNAPLEYYSVGYRNAITNYPDSVAWFKLAESGNNFLAVRFIPKSSFNLGSVSILVRKRGNPKVPFHVGIFKNNVNRPGEALFEKAITTDDIKDTISVFHKIKLPDISVQADATFWLRLSSNYSDDIDYWQVGINMTKKGAYLSKDNIIWSQTDFDLYFRITDPDNNCSIKFFSYKYLKFAIYQKDSGAPRLFVNGTIGNADSNAGTLSKLIDNSKSWTDNIWEGAKVGIITGHGLEEPSVYRNILSNSLKELIVDKPFTIPHDTSTVYVIFNTNLWTEIAAHQHGLTARVTDICVINDIIYFAQGDHKPIRRMRWAVDGTDAGWVSEDEASNAVFLTTVRHSKRGIELWRANNDDKNHAISVSHATVIDWLGNSMTVLNQTSELSEETKSTGVDFMQGDDFALMYKMTIGTISGKNAVMSVTLQESDDNIVYSDVSRFPTANAAGTYYLATHCTKRWRRVVMRFSGETPKFNNIKIVTENNLKFEEPLAFHDSFGKINKLMEYAEGTIKNLWVMREGMVFTVKTDEIDKNLDYTDAISLPELETVMEENNGSPSVRSNVYLLFALGNGIQRYYNQKLDSDGPDRDAGLPPERQGNISAMLSYPGRYFAAVDAGPNGYSSILMNNNMGWHEIYRAPNKGDRIHDLSFQAIPSGVPDRLWFACGNDILWLVMPSKTLKTIYDSNAEYTHESAVISSWLTGGMVDVSKTWNSLKLITENLSDDETIVEADYQIDQDENWYPMSGYYSTSPSQEIPFDLIKGVSGKRLRYRVRLLTKNKKKTARIKATVIEAIGTVAIKYSFGFSYRNFVKDYNLADQFDDTDPDTLQSILDQWAADSRQLRMRCVRKLFDDKRVYLEAPNIRTSKEFEEGYIGSLRANEI